MFANLKSRCPQLFGIVMIVYALSGLALGEMDLDSAQNKLLAGGAAISVAIAQAKSKKTP